MKINLGNFGQLIAQAPQNQFVDTTASVPQTLNVLSGAIDKYKQDIEDAQAMRATADLSEAKVKSEQIKYQLDQDVNEGKILPEKYTEEFNNRFTDMMAGYADKYEGKVGERFGYAMKTYQQEAQLGALQAQDGHIKDGNTANFLKTINAIEIDGSLNPEAAKQKIDVAFETMGHKTNYNQAQLETLKEKTVQGVDVGNYSLQIQSSDNINTVKAVRGSIFNSALDPQTKASLINAADAQISQLDNKQKTDTYYEIANLSNSAQYYTKAMADGAQLTPKDFESIAEITSRMEDLNKTYAGKTKEFAIQNQIDSLRNASEGYQAVLAMNGKTLQQQKQSVIDTRNMANSLTDIQEKARFSNIADAKEKAYANNVSLVTTEPYKYYEKQTGKQVADIDFSNPQTYMQLGDALKDRMAVASTVKLMTGIEPGVFKKNEIDQLKPIIDGMTPQNQTSFYRSLYTATGKDKFDATVNQLKQDDNSAAVVANLAILQRPDTERAAVEIAHGAQLAKDKTVKMKEGEYDGVGAFNTAFDDYTKGFFVGNSKAANVAREATLNAYLSLSDKAGEINPAYNEDRFNQATQIALGGNIEFNGNKVIPPYGMTEDYFHSSVTSGLKNIFAKSPELLNKIDDMTLSLPGEGYPVGSYAVMYGGERIYYDANKTKPVIITVK